ncbi:F-box protein [Vitis vinifera]|uniref:F-box protein n=1 Tax=Vitis vinifera TaxID=29760 RepID=A0A438FZT8_VITVI|nr:F-box protein [Vitis vinifera]
MHQMSEDSFDRLPDPLILVIFNSVADIKTLIRCRAVSKRFNSLVPQAETLVLKVDRVISTDSDGSFFLSFLKSIFRSLHHIISPKSLPIQPRPHNSPTQILRGFDRIRNLEIELPGGDLCLEKGAVLKWKAEFGRRLKSCVIMGVPRAGRGGRVGFWGRYGWRVEGESGVDDKCADSGVGKALLAEGVDKGAQRAGEVGIEG